MSLEPGAGAWLFCQTRLRRQMVRRQTSDERGIACGDDFYKNAAGGRFQLALFRRKAFGERFSVVRQAE